MTTLETELPSKRSLSVTRHHRVSRARISFGSIGWWLFVALWLITFTEFSADYAVFMGTSYWGGDIAVPELRHQIQLVSTVLIGVLALLGGLALLQGRTVFRAAPEIKLFLLFFTASILWGALIGWLKEVPPNYIIGDSRNLVLYLILFAVGGAAAEQRIETFRRLFLIGCGILLLKLFYSFAANFASGEAVSWRSLLKLSCFFAPMLFIALGGVLYSKRVAQRRKNTLLAFLAAFGIFAAQARGFFLGTLAGALLFVVMLLKHRRFYLLIILAIVILGIGLGTGVVLQSDITKSFGYWKGTEIFEGGMEYRIRQADMLLTRFDNNWVEGTGLGSFDPDYEGYADWQPRPYLYELEYLNLLAKLGVVGISLWLAAFFFLFVGCLRAVRKAVKPEHRGFVLGLTAGLVALMVGSFVQTGYSSVSFHLYIVLMLLVLSALRSPQLAVPPPGAQAQ